MTVKDDRAEFELARRDSIASLGRDKGVFDASVQLILDSDRHRYSYIWSWMGAPIIQRPADIVALQEILWECKPDVIVETGVARGGSVIFFASLLRAFGKPDGKVIGVDIDIRAHNRDTIEKHPMASSIVLIEGSSSAPEIVAQVKSHIPEGASVMVVLDSDHSRQHVANELRAYCDLVTKGQFFITADTILGFIPQDKAPTYYSKLLVSGDEPLAAVHDFLAADDRFVRDPINDKLIMSSSPDGYLRRIK